LSGSVRQSYLARSVSLFPFSLVSLISCCVCLRARRPGTASTAANPQSSTRFLFDLLVFWSLWCAAPMAFFISVPLSGARPGTPSNLRLPLCVERACGRSPFLRQGQVRCFLSSLVEEQTYLGCLVIHQSKFCFIAFPRA
jgi:hypothetical protein